MLFTVADGGRALRIFLQEPAVNYAYVVKAVPDWPTKTKMVNKTTNGFTLRFSDPAPPEGGVVNVEIPGFQFYTAEQMVRQMNRQHREAQQRSRSNRASALARELEDQLNAVRARPEITQHQNSTFYRFHGPRVYTCSYCGAVGQGIEWVRNHRHQTVQAPLIAPVTKVQRVKKKKRTENPRLKALVNATIGG